VKDVGFATPHCNRSRPEPKRHRESFRACAVKLNSLTAQLPDFDRLRVILVEARNPLNIGAAARAMSNFGFFHLRVVTPFEPAFRQARSAVGAAKVLASAAECESVAEAVADCTLIVGTTAIGHRDVQHPLLRLQEGAAAIRERLASGNVALLFGSEKFGLSNQHLGYCHWLLHIPAREEHTSMNLGQAVAVCLYELARDGTLQSTPDQDTPASAGEVERIAGVLREALHASGYGAGGTAASTEKKVRRLLRHLSLQKADANLCLGMLRQIVWKLREGENHEHRQASRKVRS
jgi:TrmH family RNA methyltransferase